MWLWAIVSNHIPRALVGFLTFLNLMDPDKPQLSPTRFQAWAASITAVTAAFHDLVTTVSTDVTTAAGATQTASNTVFTALSVWWSHKAHQSYNEGKKIRKAGP